MTLKELRDNSLPLMGIVNPLFLNDLLVRMVYGTSQNSDQRLEFALGLRLKSSFVPRRTHSRGSDKCPVFTMPIIFVLAHLTS